MTAEARSFFTIDLNKLLKIIEINFYDDCISSCNINYELWLIGVYLKFNNGTVEAILEHEEQIGKLFDIFDKIYEQNSTAKIAILGDFNSDLYRRTNFDDILKHLSLSSKNLQKIVDKQIF